MRPKRRYLKGNKGTEAPTSFLFFDSETWPDSPTGNPADKDLRLRLWCAIYVRREGQRWHHRAVYRGHSSEEFWNLVMYYSDRQRPLWMLAHNLGVDLTWLNFWQTQLEPGHYTRGPVDRGLRKDGTPRKPWVGRLCLEGRPTFAYLRNSKGVVKMVDTGNYWPTSLYSIGEAHGLPKGTMPTDEADEEALFQYCQRDCEVIEVAIKGLIDRWLKEQSGVFRPTAPGLAMQHWRHTTKSRAKNGEATSILLEDITPARGCERASYYGGRIQPFYIGPIGQPTFLLDCVSLYLHSMHHHPYPFRRVESLTKPTVNDLHRRLTVYGGCARVLINSDADTYPIRYLGHQCHCTGKFWTALCGPELVRAVTQGHVSECSEAHFYAMDYLFAEWAAYWFRRKLNASYGPEASKGDAEFAKLVGNSLSGKFAQKGTGWFDCQDVPAVGPWDRWVQLDRETDQLTWFRSVGWNTQAKRPSHEPAEAFPIISGFITSYAREYMRSVFKMCPPGSLLYTATDSLLVTRAGFDALMDHGMVDEDTMGKFAVKRFGRDASIAGPNWYRIGSKSVKAGLHAKAVRGTDLVWRVVTWSQLATILSTRPDGIVRLRERTLDSPRSFPKGRVDQWGWVEPYHLDDGYRGADRLPNRPAPDPDPGSAGATEWPAV